MPKLEVFRLTLVAFILSGCVTAPDRYGASKVSYEQWKKERQDLPNRVERMLLDVKAAFDANPKVFDNCFSDNGKRLSGKGLLELSFRPGQGKLELESFASPEPLAGLGHENFGHCADMILANMQIALDPSFGSLFSYRRLLKVIWPSWDHEKARQRTRIDPAGFNIDNSAVCMNALHRFYSVSPWTVLKKDGQYFSDNNRQVDEKVLLLCSGQDLNDVLRFDEEAVRRFGEPNTVDGLF